MEQEFIVNRLQKQLEDARVGGAGAIGIGVDTAMARWDRVFLISDSIDGYIAAVDGVGVLAAATIRRHRRESRIFSGYAIVLSGRLHPADPMPALCIQAEVNSLRNKINSMEQTHEHIVRQFHSTVHALKTAVLALRGLPDTPSARAELDVEFPEPDTSRPLLTPAPTPTPSGKEFAIPSSRARSRSRQTSIGETSNPFTPSTAVANS